MKRRLISLGLCLLLAQTISQAVPSAPTNFHTIVFGNNVYLAWCAAAGTVTTYRIDGMLDLQWWVCEHIRTGRSITSSPRPPVSASAPTCSAAAKSDSSSRRSWAAARRDAGRDVSLDVSR